MTSNADRITLRHNRQTVCNVLCFDGHAESVDWKNLPGGNAPTWRLDQ
jgi:prepilin-type processing-associated H-X9-DG protein